MWEASQAVYHLSLHLGDSIPSDQLLLWRAERARLAAQAKASSRPYTESEIAELKAVFNERVERYLTAGYGSCLLRRPDVADELVRVMTYGHGSQYALHTWCIMPNHLHVIVGQLEEGLALKRLITVWKRASSHRINKLLQRQGVLWQEDAYTRIIRDASEYRQQLSYVWNNPERAGLSDGWRRERYVQW